MIVTEKKIVKIIRGCEPNPVFISWLSTLGREHWLFHTIQTIGLVTGANGEFETDSTDLENSRGQIIDISKTAQPQMIIGANVEIEDVAGLKTLLYSVNAEMLMNPTTWQSEGPKWKIVRPLPGSFKLYNTNETRTDIELTINLDYTNTQRQ